MYHLLKKKKKKFYDSSFSPKIYFFDLARSNEEKKEH